MSLTTQPAFTVSGDSYAPTFSAHNGTESETNGAIGADNFTLDQTLLSPGEIGGSQTHLASVTFCYGLPSYQTQKERITNATVTEYNEAPANPGNGSAPSYAAATLLNQSLSLTGPSGGCQTVTPSAPAVIDPNGYMVLSLAVSSDGSAQAQLSVTVGRVTVTYS
jgi:hypothetical protein